MGLENLNISIFKYPLGFIRVIQFVFLVIALSAANSWHTELSFQCTTTNQTEMRTQTTSTFSMSSHLIKNCAGTPTKFWTGSWGGAAGFFYFTAVVSLIFVLIVTFSYVVLWQVYQGDKRIPLADLAVTALLFVIWFFCISIWWSASNGIGTQTGKDHVEEIFKDDKDKQFGTFESVSANNGKLAISVLSGWVLVATLALDCWFIWKEVVPRSDANPTQIA